MGKKMKRLKIIGVSADLPIRSQMNTIWHLWQRDVAWKLFALTVLLSGYAFSSQAGMGEYWEAYARGNYGTAIGELRPLAEEGNSEAQANLGHLYEEGRGVDRNMAEAAKWYRKAAEQGDTSAQTDLGRLYMFGDGVVQDKKQALFWMRKGVEQGNALAQFNLGNLYRLGLKNYQEAMKWYLKAAEAGLSEAQLNLGIMYAYAQGVRQNYREAVKWLRKAAEVGNSKGQFNLGVLYEFGTGVPLDLIQSFKWYSLAVKGSRKPVEKQNYTKVLRAVARKMSPKQMVDGMRLTKEWVREHSTSAISLPPSGSVKGGASDVKKTSIAQLEKIMYSAVGRIKGSFGTRLAIVEFCSKDDRLGAFFLNHAQKISNIETPIIKIFDEVTFNFDKKRFSTSGAKIMAKANKSLVSMAYKLVADQFKVTKVGEIPRVCSDLKKQIVAKEYDITKHVNSYLQSLKVLDPSGYEKAKQAAEVLKLANARRI